MPHPLSDLAVPEISAILVSCLGVWLADGADYKIDTHSATLS